LSFSVGGTRGTRVGLVALAVAAAALLPVARGEASGRVPKDFFGIVQWDPPDLKDAQQMRAVKVRTMRVFFNWRGIEPQRGVYRWPDHLVATLAANGIRPVFTVETAPQWATGSGNPGSPPVTSQARAAWQGFLKHAVGRYGPNGSFWQAHPGLPQEAVTAWQIWNEPNLPKSFARAGTAPPKLVKHAPKTYAKLVKASDRAIGKVDPHAKVVLAGLLGNPNRTRQSKMSPEVFLKKFLEARRITKHFSAVGLHPYAPSIKSYGHIVTRIRAVLKNGGAGRKDLWLDEVGWGSAKNRFSLDKGRRGQAKMLRKAFALTLENRRRWNVRHLYWFDWRDPSPDVAGRCSFCYSAGLLKFDRTRKASYGTFRHFARMQGKRVHQHHRHHRHHGRLRTH
jgi:polysaccharide biosynthesis protein PslG